MKIWLFICFVGVAFGKYSVTNTICHSIIIAMFYSVKNHCFDARDA